MYVSDYIEFLVNSEIHSLAVKDVGDLDPNAAVAPTTAQLENQGKLRTYLNLANLELHKRFNILQKEMLLDFAKDGEEFDLPDDFLHAISCTWEDGEEIAINNNKIKLDEGVDYNFSVMFTDPRYARIKGVDRDGRDNVILTYAASPKLATSNRTKLLLPHAYTEALLNYAAYKAYSSVSGDVRTENNTYYGRFLESCKQIELSGLVNPDNLDVNTKLADRGFV